MNDFEEWIVELFTIKDGKLLVRKLSDPVLLTRRQAEMLAGRLRMIIDRLPLPFERHGAEWDDLGASMEGRA